MASIALVVMGAEGHVRPTLLMARALVEQGHRLTYFCTAQYADMIRATGAGLSPYETTLVDGRAFARTEATAGEFPVRMLEECAHVFPQVVDRIEALAPDLILYDRMTLAGRMVAARRDRPAIMLVPTYQVDASTAVKPMFGAVAPDDPARARFAELSAKVSALAGLPPIKLGELYRHAAALNIAFIPRVFQPDADRFGPQYVFAGSQVVLPRPEPRWSPPATGRPVVFLSLGTLFHDNDGFYEKAIAAFTGSRWHVVMAVGSQANLDRFGTVPTHFEVAVRVHQIDVLSHAAAFVTHAGGGVMEALYHGVPMVAVPQIATQRTTAGRLVDLGLGLTVAKDCTPEAMRDGVETVASDPAIRRNVSAMQREIVATNGPRLAVEAINGFLEKAAAGR
jgi:MGT family glycosyltransferase